MTALRDRNLPASSKRRGFAIVMALSLLSIVFLLVISLVNLVGTDLSLADARKEKVLAQAHARMGMMVAIGEIQKHLGPDTRVSATADILDERIDSSRQYESGYYTENSTTSFQQAVANNQAIDLNENNRLDKVPFGQRYWTGVWKHRARRKGTSEDYRAAAPLPKNLETGKNMEATPMADTEYDPHPAIELAWLVSGNEGWVKKPAFFAGQLLREYLEIPDGIPSKDLQRDFIEGGIYGQAENAWLDYQTALENNLEGYEHPLIDLLDPDDEDSDTVWILRRPLLEEPISDEDDESGQWRSKLRGEPVKVKKTDILPDDPDDDRLHTHGSYAYWVGDEGVKAKVNISIPEDDQISEIQSQMDELTIAKKPNISFPEALVINDADDTTITGGFGLDFTDNAATSKTLSLATLIGEQILQGNSENNRKKIAAHYHSLSTDSHGVLADVRTGGLKRDLSHAFANARDWDETLEGATYNWLDDFLGFIYRDRVHVLKEIPMDLKAKSNEWNDNSASEPINDYKGILSGPLWRALGSFHNLYLKVASGNALLANHPKMFPRTTGDNFVLFDNGFGFPDSGGVPFWQSEPSIPSELMINTRINYFKNRNARPGPKSHPIQPVLMEFKYSQVPTCFKTLSEGKLALAMYPSVALWNPYSVPMTLSQLYVEIPFERAALHSVNPKEYDRWRKWVMWSRGPSGGGVGGPVPENPPPVPGIRGPLGLSGLMGPWGAVGSSVFSHNPNAIRPVPEFNRFFKYTYVWQNGEEQKLAEADYPYPTRNSANNYTVDPLHLYYRNKFNFLWSNQPLNENNITPTPLPVRERHLLLRIGPFTLQPGEKAHFVAKKGQVSKGIDNNYNWDLPVGYSPRQYLEIELEKTPKEYDDLEYEEKLNSGFLCVTHLDIEQYPDEPLSLNSIIENIHGVHPIQSQLLNPIDGSLINIAKSSNIIRQPKGITMYASPPHGGVKWETKPGSNIFLPAPVTTNSSFHAVPIFKITKNFRVSSGIDHWISLNRPFDLLKTFTFAPNPTEDHDLYLPGNGIRIRYQLPGTADRVVFEQYNLRALVNSYQDGFGDNWKSEHFNAARLEGENLNFYERFETSPDPNQHYTIRDDEDDEIATASNDTLQFHPPNFADFYEFNTTEYNASMTINQAILPYDLSKQTERAKAFKNLKTIYDYLQPNVRKHLVEEETYLLPIDPFHKDLRIVPKICRDNFSNSIGFFHDEFEAHGDINSMNNHNSAIMFEVPTSPMLSILQFRHANLNDYSHGPSYSLGNSYASPQVARYKSWGRVKAIAWQTSSIYMNPLNNLLAKNKWDELWPNMPSPWSRFISSENLNAGKILAPVRKVEAQNEHQNTTLDHSFYANRALLDGFWMSGVSHQSFEEDSFVSKPIGDMRDDLKDLKPGEIYYPYRNPRLLPYFRDNDLSETSYGKLSKEVSSDNVDSDYRYQTLAADLLLNGAFNINSTSVDAWISHLSSLKGKELPNAAIPLNPGKTPIPRFLKGREIVNFEAWDNRIRELSDDEVILLAHCLVEQIKLRGPFLSFADFTNRRIVGTPVNLIPHRISQWEMISQEDRNSVLGLRGAVQAAVAEARINRSSFGTPLSAITDNPEIPKIPTSRFDLTAPRKFDEIFLPPSSMNFLYSKFGMPAFSKSPSREMVAFDPFSDRKILVEPEYRVHTHKKLDYKNKETHKIVHTDLGQGINEIQNIFMYKDPDTDQWTENIPTPSGVIAFKGGLREFEGAASLGEAPDNILAVEDCSTGANKPGWVMQSDLLSPLAPVTNARSDTFVIRVMGENKSDTNRKNRGRAWIELTVQRTPDYVKKYLDAPHHRPHEPFEDRNFNGYWDNDPSFREHWLDLNQNGMNQDGTNTEGDAQPDLPGDGIYPDGLVSDLPLEIDVEEEPASSTISVMGINQRFGRKFKIIKFRWIKKQDV